MNKSSEWLAISQDDDWIDSPTFWNFAEYNSVHEMIDMINLSHLNEAQSYEIRILAPSEDGKRLGSVAIESNISENIGQQRLKILADAICRLIRPSRYEASPQENSSDRIEVFRHIFVGREATAHERIESISGIPRLARSLGRSEEGIEAALEELSTWQDFPPMPLLETQVA